MAFRQEAQDWSQAVQLAPLLGPGSAIGASTLRGVAANELKDAVIGETIGIDPRDIASVLKNKRNALNLNAPKGVTRYFNGDEAIQHFNRHGSELSDALSRSSYNLKNHLDDANHVINNGTFVPELNGFVRLIGGKGNAKYAFVGMERGTNRITTFHIKTVKELIKKAPSLGLSK